MTEMFENCCMECGCPFETDDSNAELCMKCWEKIVLNDLENEGKGTNLD